MSRREIPADAGRDRAMERQMRNWELAKEAQSRPPLPPGRVVHDCICLSRSVGSGGREVARLLADALGWPLFDKEILHAMAGEDRLRERLYASLDERSIGWLEEAVRSMTEMDFSRDDYARRLSAAVLAIARGGPAIILGRGADLILPRDHGLRVRLTAGPEYRAKRLAAEHGLELPAALKRIAKLDGEREQYIRHSFHADPADPVRYDLTIQMERFSPAQAVDLIQAGLRILGIERAS